MESFMTVQNKTLLWNTLIKLPLLSKIDKEQQILWFETQINNIYSHNKSSHSQNTDLYTFNKEALSIMINILKQVPQSSPQSSSTSPFSQVKDKAIGNLNELVELQKQRRSLEVQSNELNIINLDDKKTVSWEDQKVSHSNEHLLEKITVLENIIEDMRKEIHLIKNGTYKEVSEIVSNVINSVIAKN